MRNPYGQKNDGGYCECAECGRTFGGLTGFDRHKVTIPADESDWRCATDTELVAFGYNPDGRGVWRSPALKGLSTRYSSIRTPVEAA